MSPCAKGTDVIQRTCDLYVKKSKESPLFCSALAGLAYSRMVWEPEALSGLVTHVEYWEIHQELSREE